MYSIRAKNGPTSWARGDYSNELGYYIKYRGAYDKSSDYKNEFEKSGKSIDDFYTSKISFYTSKIHYPHFSPFG